MSVFHWLLVAAGTLAVAGVALAELLARWWLRHQAVYYVWPPGYRRVASVDLEAFPGGEARARFDVNSAGERGDEPPGPSESAYRVLVAGGSAAECGLLDQPTSWPGVLQRVLNRPEQLETLGVARVHVGNVGKSSIDSQGLAKILSCILPRYERLDVVIIMVGASNVLRWLEAEAPSDRPAPTLPDPECFAWQPRGPFRWRPKQTAIAELARRLRLRVLRPIEEKTRAGRFMTRARAMRERAKLTGQFSATVGDPSAMLDAWERSLRDALVSAMLRGDRVLLARQPWFDKPSYSAAEEAQFWHGGFGDAYEVEVTRFCSSETLAQLMTQIDGRATKVAEELGVEHVNLRAILEPTLTDYYDQYHFTAKGAAKLAAALASVLLRKAASTTTQHAAVPTSTRTDGIRGGSARNAGVASDALGPALSEDSGRIAPH